MHIILVVKPEGMRPLGRPRQRYEDNIRVDLMGIDWMWTGFIWFRIGASGCSIKDEWPSDLVSQEGLCSMEFVC
jgi:hypothetical protein